jgi:hypothetical protein
MVPEGIFILLVFVAFALILITRIPKSPKGIQGFEASTSNGAKEKEDASGVIMEETNPPYATQGINSVDDYEYNLVFRNEGDRAMTKETRDFLMSSYPKDWSTNPPSSELFQEGLAAFKESFVSSCGSRSISRSNPYKEVDGSNMTPPDYNKLDAQEKEVLATYVPKKPGELTTYDAEDAKEIIDRIYKAKGLIPDVKQVDENVFTIMGTRSANADADANAEAEADADALPKYAVASQDAVVSSGEIPVTMTEPKVRDRFFTDLGQERTRDGKWDYTSWTPGLERMFAPTDERRDWY